MPGGDRRFRWVARSPSTQEWRGPWMTLAEVERRMQTHCPKFSDTAWKFWVEELAGDEVTMRTEQ